MTGTSCGYPTVEDTKVDTTKVMKTSALGIGIGSNIGTWDLGFILIRKSILVSWFFPWFPHGFSKRWPSSFRHFENGCERLRNHHPIMLRFAEDNWAPGWTYTVHGGFCKELERGYLWGKDCWGLGIWNTYHTYVYIIYVISPTK